MIFLHASTHTHPSDASFSHLLLLYLHIYLNSRWLHIVAVRKDRAIFFTLLGVAHICHIFVFFTICHVLGFNNNTLPRVQHTLTGFERQALCSFCTLLVIVAENSWVRRSRGMTCGQQKWRLDQTTERPRPCCTPVLKSASHSHNVFASTTQGWTGTKRTLGLFWWWHFIASEAVKCPSPTQTKV